jgi:hypothetical protein
VRKQVLEWAPGGRAASCAPAVQRAARVLEGVKTGHREILFLTDLTKISWEGLAKASVKLPPELSLYIVDVGESRDRNAVIQAVSVETSGQARVNVPVQIQAILRGGDEPMDRALELVVGGRRVDSKRVKLDKYKVLTATFSYAPDAGGLLQGSVRFAEPDALAMDDERVLHDPGARPGARGADGRRQGRPLPQAGAVAGRTLQADAGAGRAGPSGPSSRRSISPRGTS